MARFTHPRASHQIQVEVTQDFEQYVTKRPSPDESWTYTDVAGHDHRYECSGYPTMEMVIDESHWCDGHEGPWNHDPHLVVDRSHWECKQCREWIVPGTHPPGRVITIPGMKSATVTGHRSDGSRITVYPTEEEVEALYLLLTSEDHPEIQRWLDEYPRVASIEYFG